MPPPEQPRDIQEPALPSGPANVKEEPDHDATMSEPTPVKETDPVPETEAPAATATPPAVTSSSDAQHVSKEETSSGLSASHDQGEGSSTNSGGPVDLGDKLDGREEPDAAPAPSAKDEPVTITRKDKMAEQSGEVAAQNEQMESSVATLKPHRPQFLTIETPAYVDPTPPTPFGSQPPSRTNSAHRSKGDGPEPSPTRSDVAYDDRRYASEDEQEGSSRSEIQSIMEQFPEEGGGPDVEEVMSPRLEIASPFLANPSPQHPPRKSSLEPLAPSIAQQIQDLQGLRLSATSPSSSRSKAKEQEPDDQGPPVPPKDSHSDERMTESPMSPTAAIHRPPPPEPEPEPSLPFDFHRFLEQLKNKKADPVARYLKSFLSEFAKRQWMVHEQVKIISDFLAFIANKMAQCDVWREVSDAEFDNAREGMEKLVMNRLYTQTFSPAIPAPQPIPGAKPKRRGGDRPMGPGRRGQHQEDVERDEILTQKINIYGWVREEHLDIAAVSDSGKRFLTLAQQGW
jgi:hypothetical protein